MAEGLLAVLVVIAMLASPGVARAQDCDEATADERIAFIRDVLITEKRRAAYWNWAWTGVFGGMGGTFGTIAIVSDDQEVTERTAITAIRSGVGLANQLVVPLRIPQVEGDDTSCATLVQAEEALRQAAVNQKAQTDWVFPRLGSLVINFGVGAALLAFGQEEWAAIGTLSGLVVSEIRFQTTPYGARDALERYNAGDFARPARASSAEWMVAPTITPESAGASLMVRW